MWPINTIVSLFLLLSIGLAQGRMNAFGLGHYYHNQGIRNAADGITDLTPSFQDNVSLSNPSTWHNLDFTYLSLSYSGNNNSMSNSTLLNGYSSLSNAVWIVPIKSKSSLGISLAPYSDQRISVTDQDTAVFHAFDDTLNVARSFDRSGGIMSFKVGSSYLLSDVLSLGMTFNILFGSARQNEVMNFGGSAVVQSSRMRFYGILNEFFISISLRDNLKAFSSYTYSMKPLEGVYEEKHLFDDANGNGYHDFYTPYYDFPFPDSVSAEPEVRLANLHSPIGYHLGLSQFINTRTSIAFEFGVINDDAEISDRVYIPLDNWITRTNTAHISFSRYPNDLSLNLSDKLSFKFGLTYYNHTLNDQTSSITEVGGSLGLGFKFKPVGNQIDINYYLGFREYPDIADAELVQQVQVGISLADLWFVKRRQK